MRSEMLPKFYESRDLAGWSAIRDTFDSFPPPVLHPDSGGDLRQAMWIFRGHKSDWYDLEPSIERECRAGRIPWAALELKVRKEEFLPRARMLLRPADRPPSNETLSWLAFMQHHGVPTRLLDFTFSPYIALYFALSDRTSDERSSGGVAIWAMNAAAVRERSEQMSGEAYSKEVKEGFRKPQRFPRWRRGLVVGERGQVLSQLEARRELLSRALAPGPVRRECFNKRGFVAFAMPPVQNVRLLSQQGAFLFNGAEDLTFKQSLFRMMGKRKDEWCVRFRIDNAILREAEEKLYRLNIHALSLFPDMQGLAGFIRQKLRLYRVPNRDASAE